MKLHKSTISSMFIGLIIIILSFTQWQIWNNDPSQFVFGVGFALIIIAISYIYSVLKLHDAKYEEFKNDLMAIEKNYNELLSWKTDVLRGEGKDV